MIAGAATILDESYWVHSCFITALWVNVLNGMGEMLPSKMQIEIQNSLNSILASLCVFTVNDLVVHFGCLKARVKWTTNAP